MKPTLVVPCYNEARRLDGSTFVEGSKLFAALVFVDDGSTDATASLLETTVRGVVDGGGVSSLVTMDRNAGKGEAVRRGVKVALELVGPQHPVAFADADLSTPLDEIVRLTGLLRALDRDVVIGSRVGMLGRVIERSPMKHVAGRIGATIIARLLGLKAYDTQAGAKVFRGAVAGELFGEPFVSRWLFDCEILLRAEALGAAVYEEPLAEWRDRGHESKVTPPAYLRSLRDLLRIRRRYRSG